MASLSAEQYSAEQSAEQRETLFSYRSRATFLGSRHQPCRHMTSACPDRCSHASVVYRFKLDSLTVAKNEAAKNAKWVTPVAAGMAEHLVGESNLGAAGVLDAARSLSEGDRVMLDWNHDYVTRAGCSAPERPVAKLRKLLPSAAVGALRASDRVQWESLYRAYVEFYKRDEPPAFYEMNWTRLLEGTAVHALVARDPADDGKLLGLAHFVPHTSMRGERCYLQDLFTRPAARGQGVATRLIDGVAEWCRGRGGVSTVYWVTHERNDARSRLYDVVGVNKGYVKYQIDLL